MDTAATDCARGLRPALHPGAQWLSQDYHAVLLAIAASPHAAVRVSALAAALDGAGDAKLDSLLEHNHLVRRSYDARASDVPAAAFEVEGGGREEVLTLPSAAHVLAARRWSGRGAATATTAREKNTENTAQNK